jgi:hypothetical protein
MIEPDTANLEVKARIIYSSPTGWPVKVTCLRRAEPSLPGFVGIIRAMITQREHFYTRFRYPRSSSDRSGGVVDVRRLWTGGLVTAVIVCGLGIAAFLLVHGMLNIPLLGLRGDGAAADASMVGYATGAALAALLATAAMHFLLVTSPRPRWFFQWLAGVGTAIAVLVPLALAGELGARCATATINLILGLAIIALVRSTAASSLFPVGSAELAGAACTPVDEG